MTCKSSELSLLLAIENNFASISSEQISFAVHFAFGVADFELLLNDFDSYISHDFSGMHLVVGSVNLDRNFVHCIDLFLSK